jgi:hypothetical protein
MTKDSPLQPSRVRNTARRLELSRDRTGSSSEMSLVSLLSASTSSLSIYDRSYTRPTAAIHARRPSTRQNLATILDEALAISNGASVSFGQDTN